MMTREPIFPDEPILTERDDIIVDDYQDAVIGTGSAPTNGDSFVLDDYDEAYDAIGTARVVVFAVIGSALAILVAIIAIIIKIIR